MNAVDRFIESFSRGEVPPLDELAGAGYSFTEPLDPGPYNAVGQVEVIGQVLDAFPDRRLEVQRRVPGADGVLVEATWMGTPAGSGGAEAFA